MRLNKLLAILAMALAVFTACEKEETKPEPLVLPELSTPSNNSILKDLNLTEDGLISKVRFSWKEKQTNVKYIVCISEDNSNWTEADYAPNSGSITILQGNYAFEFGKTYYWKLKLFRMDKDGEPISDEFIETEVYSFTTDIVGIKNLSLKSSSYTHWPEDYQGTKAFIDLTWEDAPNMEYAEITFTPAVAGIEQPIKVNKGEESVRIEGFEGLGSVAGSPEAQVYEFFVKTHGIDNLVSEAETFNAQPLTKSFVHDYDFNTYAPIKIGEQVWLSSNLRTTHYNDGTPIPEWRIKHGWADAENSYDEIMYELNADIIYDFLGLVDKGVCPDGFTIPSPIDFEELTSFIGVADDDLGTYHSFIGADRKVANALKSEEGWGIKVDGSPASGSDPFHFNLKPNQYGIIKGKFTSSGVDEYTAIARLLMGYATLGGGSGVATKIFATESDGIMSMPGFEYGAAIRCILITDEE